MIVFGNRVHVDQGFGCGRGMTSDLRKRDPELENILSLQVCLCGNMRLH